MFFDLYINKVFRLKNYIQMFLLLLLSINLFTFSLFSKNGDVAYLLIDYNTGQILAEENSKDRKYPASLTKLMTLYILFDKLEKGEINIEDNVILSKKAASQEPTKLGIPSGSSIKIKDAILSIIIKSHNDIAYAVAEKIAPIDKFINMMNDTALQLGMNDTHFVNPNGLHNSNQYTTANDMAKLAKALMVKHNAYYSLFSVDKFKWGKITYHSTNHILDYNGIDGIKTGYTRASGFNLVSSAKQGDVRVIAVLMGFNSYQDRDKNMKELISYGLEIAHKNREKFVDFADYIIDTENNLSTTDKSMIYDVSLYEASFGEFGENSLNDSTDKDTKNSDSSIDNTMNDSKSEFNTDEEIYPIENIPYVKEVLEQDTATIHPLVKAPPKTIKYSNHYSVQVGLFHGYNKSLNYGFNTLSLSYMSHYFKKKNLVLHKVDGNSYKVRFMYLTHNDAYKACELLKKHDRDCYVFKS